MIIDSIANDGSISHTNWCAVHELPKEGVTLVTGCGSQAQLDRVMARLAALQGSVVDDFHLWPPAKRGTSGAVQVTIFQPHSGLVSNGGEPHCSISETLCLSDYGVLCYCRP